MTERSRSGSLSKVVNRVRRWSLGKEAPVPLRDEDEELLNDVEDELPTLSVSSFRKPFSVRQKFPKGHVHVQLFVGPEGLKVQDEVKEESNFYPLNQIKAYGSLTDPEDGKLLYFIHAPKIEGVIQEKDLKFLCGKEHMAIINAWNRAVNEAQRKSAEAREEK